MCRRKVGAKSHRLAVMFDGLSGALLLAQQGRKVEVDLCVARIEGQCRAV